MTFTSPSSDEKIGSYVLLEKLGAGGIGEVWKARDRRLNRVVALKFISAERHGSSPPGDLLREARAASALNHPNIITIFEVGESGGATYLAMEFVEGETLRARLKRPPLALEESLEIARQIAEGLAAAHRNGIIHRDLKPENIMLRADGYVKLLDFGLAKVMPWTQQSTQDFSPASPGTESGMIVGTLTYMSPEQARGHRAGPASDVFSFGIVLYEMLTGEHPFRAETPMDTMSAILSREPPPLSARSPSVPAEFSDICARALAKESSQRYSSAVELREQLKRAGMAAALVLVICALVGLLVWSAERENVRESFRVSYLWLLGIQFGLLGLWCASACGQAISRAVASHLSEGLGPREVVRFDARLAEGLG